MAGYSKSPFQATSEKLAEIFHKISILEAEIENYRYSLSKNRDFDPYSAFKALDRLDLGSLSSSEFQGFLESQRVFCTNDEAYLLVRQYDSKMTGRLGFQEFINLVLPSTNPGFRELALARQGNFNPDVAHLMTKLIEQEVKYHRSLEALRREIILIPEFNLLEAFRIVDGRNSAAIDREDLMRFVKKFFSLYEHDVDAIFRRLDNDADGLLNYSEFVDCVMPSRTVVQVSRDDPRAFDQRAVRNSSPLRNPNKAAKSASLTPVDRRERRTHEGLERNTRYDKDLSAKNVSFKEPLVTTVASARTWNREQETQFRPFASWRNERLASDLKTRSSPLRQSPSKSAAVFKESLRVNRKSVVRNEVSDFIQVLHDHVKMNRQIEAVKNNLALRRDFEINQVFKSFDKYDLGIITCADFENEVSNVGVRIKPEDAALLFRNVSRLQDHRIRFADFVELMTPKSEEYARILKSRAGSDRVFELSKETKGILGNAWVLIVECEVVAERHRQRLARQEDFDSFSTFNALDKDHNGYITSMEFAEMLKQFSVPFNLKDLQCIMQKFDKNNDGRVSYSEFIEEMTPKSSFQY